MASTPPFRRSGQRYYAQGARPVRLARRMSVHCAAALMLFTMVQVALVLASADFVAPGVLPVVALAMLALIAIPMARATELRWARLASDALPCPALLSVYRRDRARLWFAAFAVPLAWIGATLLVMRYFAS